MICDPSSNHTSQLTIAAGMRVANPSTEYLFLNIHVELSIPGDRTSIRGLHSKLIVEEISQRPRLHMEETGSASWDARFRMQRNAGRTSSPDECLVQVLVHICMIERLPDPNVFMTRQFVHAVAHTPMVNPYAESIRDQRMLLGEEGFRKMFWARACLILYTLVTTAHLINSS